MAAPERPAASNTYLADNWFLVPAIENVLAPTVAELTATDTLDITLMVFSEGSTWPTSETGTVSQAARYGDDRQYQTLGRTTVNGGTLVYAYSPQGAADALGRKMYSAIPAGRELFLVRRLAVAQDASIASGQEVSVYPVQFAQSYPTTAGEGEAGQAAQSATYVVSGPEGPNVKVVA